MPELLIERVTSKADWAAARAIRQRVFVEEQECPPAEEWDAHDAQSRHLVGSVAGHPVAVARWRAVLHEGAPTAKLERFAVLPAHRGKGYGRALVGFAIEDARRAGFCTFLLHAQAHLEDFYARFGFAAFGKPFVEAGIPHVAMRRRDAPNAKHPADPKDRQGA